MKIFILLSLCTCALSLKLNKDTIEQWTAMCRPYEEKCIKQSGVQKELADSKYTNLDYPDDPAFKCYMDCLVRALGFIDSNNKCARDTIMKTAKGVHSDLLDACIEKAEKSSQPCEAGYILAHCGISGTAKLQNS
uniref:Uncharacterized protein n=1 Tax=Photinus pyralis TaxID=7054 RepID=A0A1Y1LX03_PHOPY